MDSRFLRKIIFLREINKKQNPEKKLMPLWEPPIIPHVDPLWNMGVAQVRVGAQSGVGPGPGWGTYGPLWAHMGPFLLNK